MMYSLMTWHPSSLFVSQNSCRVRLKYLSGDSPSTCTKFAINLLLSSLNVHIVTTLDRYCQFSLNPTHSTLSVSSATHTQTQTQSQARTSSIDGKHSGYPCRTKSVHLPGCCSCSRDPFRFGSPIGGVAQRFPLSFSRIITPNQFTRNKAVVKGKSWFVCLTSLVCR